MILKIINNPRWNKTNTMIAAIEEISINPMGGITFLKGSRKGS